MKLFIRLIGPLIFLIIIFFYIDFNQLKQIVLVLKWNFFFLSLVLVPVLVFIRSSRWHNILTNFGIPYSLWQCYKLYFIEMVAIMIVATVGTFVKIFYFKRDKYGLLQPTLSIITDKYYDYLLPLIFGLASVFIVWIKLGPGSGFIVLLLATGLAYIPVKKSVSLFTTKIFPKRLKEFFTKKGWNITDHLLKIENALNLKTYIYSVTAFGIYFLCIYFLNKGINIELSFFQVILIMTITSLITMIPISFLGIGTRDVGLLAVFQWFGETPEQAVALSMALLLLRIAIVFMGSIFWFMDPPPLNELRKL